MKMTLGFAGAWAARGWVTAQARASARVERSMRGPPGWVGGQCRGLAGRWPAGWTRGSLPASAPESAPWLNRRPLRTLQEKLPFLGGCNLGGFNIERFDPRLLSE